MTRLTSSQALLDIVVVTHSQAGWLDLCIRAVEHHTKNPYRLIIVAQAPTPEVENLIRQREIGDVVNGYGPHTVIRLAENRSFSNGVNAGVRAGSSKYVVVLNDDALVSEGWDTALLQDLTNKANGLVGARSNYAGGAQSDPSFVGEPPYVVFVCAGFRREVWNTVGPLDEENFDGFSSEDVDYSWRIKKAGFKLALSSAYVLHAGSRSLVHRFAADAGFRGGTVSTGQAESVKVAMAQNNEKYGRVLQDKWGKEWVADHTRLVQKVLVATYHPNYLTPVEFMGRLMSLKRTDGYTFNYYHHTRSPIHIARQLVCDYATDQGFDVLVQLDDDALFPSDLIRRLLAHDKEIVCALAYQRKQPHAPCVFEIGPDGMLGTPMMGLEHTGLRKADVSGYHCSAVRTSVIKKMRDAGIRAYFGGFEEKIGEDFAFSLNAKKIGVQLYVDTELEVGHLGDPVNVDENYRKAWLEKRLPPAQQ